MAGWHAMNLLYTPLRLVPDTEALWHSQHHDGGHGLPTDKD